MTNTTQLKPLAAMTPTEFDIAPLVQRAEFIATSDAHGYGPMDAARYWLQKWTGNYDSQEAKDNWLDCEASDYPWTDRTYRRIVADVSR